jgi:hypothetical protein
MDLEMEEDDDGSYICYISSNNPTFYPLSKVNGKASLSSSCGERLHCRQF